MNKEAIYHRTYSEYCFALSQYKVVFRLRTKKDDLFDCILYFGDRMDYHGITCIWDNEDDIFHYYNKIFQLRKDYMENMLGDYISLGADECCIAYLRKARKLIFIVINNTGQEVEHNYTIHTTQIEAKDYITEKTYELTNGNVFIKLAGYEAAVIVYNIYF